MPNGAKIVIFLRRVIRVSLNFLLKKMIVTTHNKLKSVHEQHTTLMLFVGEVKIALCCVRETTALQKTKNLIQVTC